mgnify:CR=1 FL=1
MGRKIIISSQIINYLPPPLQLHTFEGIPCVFFPFIRNVLVTHSFCVSAHLVTGISALDTSFSDRDIEIIEKELKASEKVLTPAQIIYL